MNDNCRNGGPDLRLLLIPAAVAIRPGLMLQPPGSMWRPRQDPGPH